MDVGSAGWVDGDGSQCLGLVLHFFRAFHVIVIDALVIFHNVPKPIALSRHLGIFGLFYKPFMTIFRMVYT